MPAALDIVGKNYFMVIIPLNGMLYFMPCILPTGNFLSAELFYRINDTCITNLNGDKVLSADHDSIEDYINETGNEDCAFVDNLLGKMFEQATSDQHAEHRNNLVSRFMDLAIIRAIQTSTFHRDVDEKALESWIYVIITPPDWGKRVSKDAFFALFAKSRCISPFNALVVAAFEPLLVYWLPERPALEDTSFFNSQNLVCEFSVGKTGEALLSVNIFLIQKQNNSKYYDRFPRIDSFLSKPTLFFESRIQMDVGYRAVVALFRDAVHERTELSALFCNELLNILCRFLLESEKGYRLQGSKMLDQIHPFQEWDFSEVATTEDVAALRLITLQDIYAVLSPQLGPIILEMQAAIEKELCITRVFFTVIPEAPRFYPENLADTLFICLLLLKFNLQKGYAKEFQYLYDRNGRYDNDASIALFKYIGEISAGAGIVIMQKLKAIYREFPPLSSLVDSTIEDKGCIDTINYVYLSSSQVLAQSANVHENGAIRKLSTQKSKVITLDQFMVMNDSDSRFDETALRFRFSESALFLLESMFPNALHEFTTLYRRPFPGEDAACMPCLDLKRWVQQLYKKCEQILCLGADEQGLNYTGIMFDLASRQSDTGSPRNYMTQQKHIGTFLMVYFGYLKETLAKDFGQDSNSTRYILVFEHLLRNITIGQADDILLRRALDQCGWVSEAEENKRKFMVYDIEDSFPISECLQKENIEKIPAKNHFAVVTMTRYYVKTCGYQALEDVLPTDKHGKALKRANSTYHIDFYGMICETIWQHVLESVYETDTLLEYQSSVDIVDIDFSLQTYKSFKKAFLKYILSTFPFTYASHPDERHKFLMQKNCSIVLTNRLVLQSGVLPALKSFMGLTSDLTHSMDYVFYRPSNFDDQENPSLPMLELIGTEMKKLLEIRFEKLILASERQFGFVHPYQYLNPLIGDTAFGYEALKIGVIRAIRPDTFAISFQYLTDDKASLVEIITRRPGPPQLLRGGNACIITKAGSPYDNISSDVRISDIAFKIPDLTSVQRVFIYKIHDIHQKNIGEIITIQNYNYTTMTCSDMGEILSRDDFERFKSYPIVNPQYTYYFSGCNNLVTLHSFAMERSLETMLITEPMKLAYIDSYEVRS